MPRLASPGRVLGNFPADWAWLIGIRRTDLDGILQNLPQAEFYVGDGVTEFGQLQDALEIIDDLVQDGLPPVSEITHAGQFVAVSDGTDMNMYYSARDPRFAGIEYTSAPDPDESGTFGASVGIPGTTDFGTMHTPNVNRFEHEIGVTGPAELRIDASLVPNTRGTPPGTDDNIRITLTDVADDSTVGSANVVYSQTSVVSGIRSFVSDAAFPVADAATATRYRAQIERQLADDSWVNVYPEFQWVVWDPPRTSEQTVATRDTATGAIGLGDLSPEARAVLDPEYAIITADPNLVAAIGTRFMSERVENDLHRGGLTVTVNPYSAIQQYIPAVYDRLARRPSDNLAVNRTISFDHGFRAESGGQGGVVNWGFLAKGMPRPMGTGETWVFAGSGRTPSNFTFLNSLDFHNDSMILLSLGKGAETVRGTPNRQLDLVIREDGSARMETNTDGLGISGTHDSTLALGNSEYFKWMLQIRRVSSTPDVYQV